MEKKSTSITLFWSLNKIQLTGKSKKEEAKIISLTKIYIVQHFTEFCSLC